MEDYIMAVNLAEKLELREGSKKALLANSLTKGKPVKVPVLLKKLYGNVKDESRSAFNIRLGDLSKSLAAKKAGKIERDTEADTVTLK
jgi:hypothetical protein